MNQRFVLCAMLPSSAYELMRELSARLQDTDAKMLAHLQRKNEQLRRAYLGTVTAVANAIEARDPCTRGHTDRATTVARAVTRRKEAFNSKSHLHDSGEWLFSCQASRNLIYYVQ